MEYINGHMSGFWIALGFALLAAEVLLFGFTTIIFLFAGLGALASGLLMGAGLIPETWIAGTACFGIATGVSSVALWKPLKAMQNKAVPQQKAISDIIGLEFVLLENIDVTTTSTHRYSGIEWKVELDPSCEHTNLAKGDGVKVASLEVGVLRVTNISAVES